MAMIPGSMDNVDPEQIKTVGTKVYCNFIRYQIYSYNFQFKDFLISYNKLSELCFNDCATDFTTRSVKPHEVSLIALLYAGLVLKIFKN